LDGGVDAEAGEHAADETAGEEEVLFIFSDRLVGWVGDVGLCAWEGCLDGEGAGQKGLFPGILGCVGWG
jgi:hypothetical protein